MTSKIVCLTNNPLWGQSTEFIFVNGVSWEVFIRARDLIHLGWRFLGHPLYGNFNPYRHPYRTLLLAGSDTCIHPVAVDIDSLSMLETALEAVRSEMRQNAKDGEDKVEKKIPQSIKDDFALLDKALMEETIYKYISRRGRP